MSYVVAASVFVFLLSRKEGLILISLIKIYAIDMNDYIEINVDE